MPAGYPQENINCVSEDSLEYPVINRWGWDIGFYCHFQKCLSYIPPCVGGYAWVSTICLLLYVVVMCLFIQTIHRQM